MNNQGLILTYIIAVFVLCLALVLTGKPEQQAEYNHYCEMVEIYKDSGGEYGWPPFRGECE